MAAGSALFWVGSVWHGGGSNITEDRERQVAASAAYASRDEPSVSRVHTEMARGFASAFISQNEYREKVRELDGEKEALAREVIRIMQHFSKDPIG